MNLFSKINKIKNVQVKKDNQALISLVLNLSLLLLTIYPFLLPGKVNAAVTESFVRFDRHATGAAISGTACLKSTLTTQTNVVLVFPLSWTISSTPGDWTVTTTNLPTDPVGGGAASAWPGIGTATSVTGVNVQFPGSAFSAGTLYCFNFTGASSTIGAAGNDKVGQLKTQGGSPYTDSVNWATSVVASGADQITVSASVSATMTFSLSGTTADLGTLSTSSVTSATAVTQTVSTNARNGWTSWIKGSQGTSTTGALHSTAANADISAPAAWNTVSDLSSTTGYVLDVNSGTGTPTVNAGYDGTGDDNLGGTTTTLFRETATKTTPGSGDTINLRLRAKIASTQAAASDYSDTLTVVAAGSF